MNFSEGDRSMSESAEHREPMPASSGELEQCVDQYLNKVGRALVKQWIEKFEGADPDPRTSCSWCGKEAKLFSKRPRVINTPFGAVRYQRSYYICPDCHHSTCPLDEWLNPFESLRGMRNQMAFGAHLPVDRLAKSWKLGKSRSIPICPSVSDPVHEIVAC